MESPQLFLREAQPSDLPSIIALNDHAGTAARWNESHFRGLFGEDAHRRLTLVAEQGGNVVGFLVAADSARDWEIENVVVDRVLRRAGIAGELVSLTIKSAREKGGLKLLLEVRPSNAPAIALYRKAGFRQDGIRKSYYSNPTEDALLFSLSLKNSS